MRTSPAGPRRPGRMVAVVAIAFVLSFALVACSGDSDEATVTTTVAAEPTVVVTLDDYVFIPAVLDLDGVGLVDVRNVGGVEHTWSVLATPIESESELGTADVLVEARVGVSQAATVDISGLEPGRYQVICAIPGHFSLGMVGELVIEG